MKLSSYVGVFGKYHALLCFLIFIAVFNTGLDHMAFIFIAPPTKFICSIPNGTTCCSYPEYDKTVFHRTVITEWNLVCNSWWLREFHQILFQTGVLLGSLIFGKMSDRYGRRHSLLTAVIIHIFTGLIQIFMPGYWSFTIWRMVSGVSEGGIIIVSFVLLLEYIDVKHRVIVSILFHVPFLLGHIMLTLCAYCIRDYIALLLIISVPNLTFLILICLLPESPLWLLAKGQTFKAIKLVEKIAKINKKPTNYIAYQIELYQYYVRTAKETNGKLTDIFRCAHIKINLFIVGFLWFLGGFCYYGGTHYIVYMNGDMFINQAGSGFMCLCGCFIALPLINYLRRRTLVVLFNLSSGFFFLTVPVFHGNAGSIVFISIGIMFSFMNIIIVFLYCFEMFPILARNVALGFSSIMFRVGAIIAQFVVALHVCQIWLGPAIFGTVSTVAAFSYLYFLPDIKDCAVEEIEVAVLRQTSIEERRIGKEVHNSDRLVI